jgi:rfaE bifunctional protein nucleotidyltransferase chain/domain
MKLMTPQEARIWRVSLREAGKRLVFTNGVFDLLHAGHVEYLQKAASFGDALLLGLNSDASVRRQNKGLDRPICNWEDRILVLSALTCISKIVVFDEDTPLSLIQTLEPDVLVKGADYKIEDIVGAKEVLASGGEVQRVDLRPGRSTSSLLQRIRAGSPSSS